MLEWFKVLGPIVISWPTVGFVAVILLRKPLVTLFQRFAHSGSKAELGPLKVEFGQIAANSKEALSKINEITELMAQSRQLELEITAVAFGS